MSSFRGNPDKSFHSQVPRSLEAKERPESELEGVRSRTQSFSLAQAMLPKAGGLAREGNLWSGLGDGSWANAGGSNSQLPRRAEQFRGSSESRLVCL